MPGGQDGGGDDGGGGPQGVCPGVIGSGQSCASPCSDMSVDGNELCLQSCSSGSDCTQGGYSVCNTGILNGVCVPMCSSDSDCTSVGFGACGPNSYCE